MNLGERGVWKRGVQVYEQDGAKVDKAELGKVR